MSEACLFLMKPVWLGWFVSGMIVSILVGPLLSFNSKVIMAVFMWRGIMEVVFISIVTLENSGDNIFQKCL